MCNFKTRLEARGYPKILIESTLSDVSFAGWQSELKKQTKQTKGKNVFCDDIPSRGQKLKTNTNAKMESHPKSATAENNLYNASYFIIQKRKSLKDMLVRAKL